MKKRLVFVLLLVTILAFTVGMGSYAWFTATYETTGNEFNTQELKLMLNFYGNPDFDGDGISDSELMTIREMLPGQWAYLPGFQVFNTSLVPVKVRMDIVPGSSTKTDGSNGASILDVVELKADITYEYVWSEDGSGQMNTETVTIDYLPLEQFLAQVNEFLDASCQLATQDNVVGFKPSGDNFTFQMYARLPETVGNQYQGVTSNFNLKFTATQIENPGWTE